MIGGIKRKAAIVVRRDEHEMSVMRAGAERFARLSEVGKLGVADLQNTRPGEAFFIHVFTIRARPRFARHDFHAVGRFDGVELWDLFEIKKPTAPRAVV